MESERKEYISNTTYQAVRFDGPTEEYPDLGGGKTFGENNDQYFVAIAWSASYITKGSWILTPSNDPMTRIICSDENFKANYSPKERPQ